MSGHQILTLKKSGYHTELDNATNKKQHYIYNKLLDPGHGSMYKKIDRTGIEKIDSTGIGTSYSTSRNSIQYITQKWALDTVNYTVQDVIQSSPYEIIQDSPL